MIRTANKQQRDRDMTSRWIAVVIAVAGCSQSEGTSDVAQEVAPAPAVCDYPQAFGTGTHAGLACPAISGLRVVAAITQDPDAQAESNEIGFLQYHESPPLTLGDYVIVPSKSGFSTSSDDNGVRPATESWSLQALKWVPSVTSPSAKLVPAWTQSTDWQPVDVLVGSFGSYTNGYVQGFYPAIVGSSVVEPAKFGRVRRVSLATGAVIATVDPFAGTAFSGDPSTIVVSGLAVAKTGAVLYTVTAFPNAPGTDRSDDPRSSWLVRVNPDNSSQVVEWRSIAASAVGVPQRNDLCEYPFGTNGTPQPTGPDSRPPLFGCGFQRPAMNAPPAIDDDGTVYVYSYGNNAQGAAFIIALDGTTLRPLRAFDTRGHLLHGCGVRLGIFGNCAVLTADGTVNLGVDPNFNGPVRFRGNDLMDSAVSINGSLVCVGGYDGGFSFGGGYDARGALVCFDKRTGAFAAANQEFGWEVTVSGAGRLYQDRNLYSDLDLGVASYAASFTSPVIGTIPVDFSSIAVDFLDANVAFDGAGSWYGVNGNGHAYQFGPDGSVTGVAELDREDGSRLSMETLSGYWARDRAGRAYVSYAGRVFVLGGGGPSAAIASPSPAQSANLRAGAAAKAARAAGSQQPSPPN